jgi:pimeloyl-ACP methyl ester carboxylesterase
MHIETIHTSATVNGVSQPLVEQTPKGTVVLLHGVCFAAWYWETNFQPWFTKKGYEVIAVSYRNHGKSEKNGSLKWRTINEYIDDVHSVVSKIEGPVYLIGHSMGGFITQHYLQKHLSQKIKKAVLLCTVPASGIVGATLQVIKTYPFSFLQALLRFSFIPVFNNKQKAKKLMFAPTVTDELIDAVVPRMQDESFRAYIDMMFLNLPSTKPTNVPLLIIGGADDFLVRPNSLKKAAAKLNVELVIMPGGHNINMEQGWERVAEKIDLFFNTEK